ncbi:hypothetical protein F5890DRAFT_1477758 [Lentinula detonsa]|uniref:Uncharacterized protein n=1 Tax=Lentinula detonsa TaxID=2804962 RepID=A0AA38PRP4_9AGAR|nr:hypothetical protein F5890DRAFT_1477758 [Lentinula detonsa]
MAPFSIPTTLHSSHLAGSSELLHSTMIRNSPPNLLIKLVKRSSFPEAETLDGNNIGGTSDLLAQTCLNQRAETEHKIQRPAGYFGTTICDNLLFRDGVLRFFELNAEVPQTLLHEQPLLHTILRWSAPVIPESMQRRCGQGDYQLGKECSKEEKDVLLPSTDSLFGLSREQARVKKNDKSSSSGSGQYPGKDLGKSSFFLRRIYFCISVFPAHMNATASLIDSFFLDASEVG